MTEKETMPEYIETQVANIKEHLAELSSVARSWRAKPPTPPTNFDQPSANLTSFDFDLCVEIVKDCNFYRCNNEIFHYGDIVVRFAKLFAKHIKNFDTTKFLAELDK